MYGAKFDFLNEVEVTDVTNNQVYFTLSNSVNQDEANITAYVSVKDSSVSTEINHTGDPQDGFDVDVDCKAVDADFICFVDDVNNVHAIQDMPFKLTGDQLNSINDQLEEMAIDEFTAAL